jgi:RNA-directed DNA polymerase
MSENRLLTRQELYDRIRSGSKDEVTIQEMVRLGFWTLGATPDDPGDELLRIAELERKIRALATEGVRLHNVDAMKAELHKRRLQAARERREETKKKREDARKARHAVWVGRKAKEVLWLGEGMSHTLAHTTGKARDGLPDLQTGFALAQAMGVPLGRVRFLAFHRKVSDTTHYRRFTVPKKTGGTRLISAPMPKMKQAQTWILKNILEKVPVHTAAHGFVPGRSIVTNAAAHVGRAVVVNMDLKDFFPTLGFPRVFGLFRSLGYSRQSSTILASICTEPDVETLELDGKRWYVHASERRLPQGSPASPMITNLVCHRLDHRLSGLAAKLGFTYTRYADDLTFSGDPTRVQTLLGAVRGIVTEEGFVVHPDKTRIMRRASRQEVTGLIVNDRLGVPRDLRDRWRAVAFKVRMSGPEGKKFGNTPDVMAALYGFAAFVRMVDPENGRPMLAEIRELVKQYGWTPKKRPPPKPKVAPAAAPGVRTTPAAPAPTLPRGGGMAIPAAGGDVKVTRTPDSPEGPTDTPTEDKPKAKWWEFWKK